MRIYIDVETVPSQAPKARENVRLAVKPPGNIKKPESIAEWWAKEGEAAIEEAYRRQSFDAAAGELVSISWAGDDCNEAHSAVRGPGESEGAMLAMFFGQLQAHLQANAIRDLRGNEIWEDAPYFIAHNASFDLGFLWRRSIILGMRPPFKVPDPSAREGKDYGCTMARWAGYRGTIGMDRLCCALGVETPKGDMEGGMVFDAWLSGETERIARYNGADVLAVRAIWHRLNWEAAT
jgi:3'-5' exonuclease